MIDVWCTVPHYAAHLRPIWEALPPETRGRWHDTLDDPRGGELLMVGAYRDLQWVGQRYQKTVLVEHGIGQTYSDAADHPAYPGGERGRYDLLIAPGRHVVDPAARSTAYIGCPKLDPWLSGKRRYHSRHVVLSFHWDCEVSPEAGTAFWDYLPHLETLAKSIGDLFIHAHPRIQDSVFEQVVGLEGCEPIADFEWVLDSGSVYCCDNSSSLYEFAATGRPVVQLQASRYRPTARHGKRFYDWRDIGPTCWNPDELPLLINVAYFSAEHEQAREQRVRQIYDVLDGTSSAKAAQAVIRLLG